MLLLCWSRSRSALSKLQDPNDTAQIQTFSKIKVCARVGRSLSLAPVVGQGHDKGPETFFGNDLHNEASIQTMLHMHSRWPFLHLAYGLLKVYVLALEDTSMRGFSFVDMLWG